MDLIDRIMTAFGFAVRACVYVMLALPALIVVISSFSSDTVLRFPPTGFSLRWYKSAWESEPFMSSLWTSTYIGLLASLIALAIGFAAAFAIDRYKFPGRAAFQALALSPLIVPGIVLGIGLVYLFAWVGLNQTVTGIVVAHVVLATPYVVRTVLASLSLFDQRLEEAAMNLRAPPWVVVRRITLPLLLPGVLSAAVFAFVVSFGNVTVTAFLTYDDTVTLPVRIFSYVQQSSGPFVAAIASIMIAVTLIVIVTIERLIGADRLA
jgi:putative spermidine/putrescine transport system permease protein